ncbi:Metallo-dependent hydrolase [Dendrothele bispora CBS 962.96]|uniref:adenosine deaminase n=1 Tax=Dendrothele bispora (strain CBS 962.96) TaxID=1314807 RepID=A0A4V6T539_DENBC|nr:Metallo-dependent hydrolase [Dendrothele bispora CBS 962.96]
MALSLADYAKEREELISLDRALRADHRREPLSPTEVLADKVIRDVRMAEASSIWTAEYPSIPHPFPGMEFLTGRSVIVQTKLFEILIQMPKGALLHAHLDATVNVPFLLDLALKQPAIHVRSPVPLDSSNLKSTLPEFQALPQHVAENVISLTDAQYEPNTWVPIKQARETFGTKLGGPEGFDQWVTGALTIDPSEAYGTHNTVTKIWQKFLSTFRVSNPIIRYVPIFKEYVREFLKSSIADGISYVEPRVNFVYKGIIAADGTHLPHRELLLIFDQVLNEIKRDMKQQGREDDFIGARIIYSTVRFITPDELYWFLEDCIALKKEFPHLIAAFDLVGDENVSHPLKYYAEPLLKFHEMQKKAGVDEIPFIFHAGETLGDGTEADMNLYDAILLGTKRIGHGFSLIKHPKLIEMCKEREIAVEVCPISNEILRLTSSMHMHPLPALLNHGVRVALCSDDPAVFGSMGLTYDFFQVLAASEITGIIQLGEMAKDSIKFSTLDPPEKQRALDAWKVRWEKFLKYAVSTGTEYIWEE